VVDLGMATVNNSVGEAVNTVIDWSA